MNIAVGVDPAEVAGDEEAVFAQLGRRLLRHLPVALEHVGAAHLDLPISPCGTSAPVSGSVIFSSTPGSGKPTVPARRSPS
jgi:hypothetical protein